MQALWTVPLDSFLAQSTWLIHLDLIGNKRLSLWRLSVLIVLMYHTGSIRERRLPKSQFGSSGRIFTQSGIESIGNKDSSIRTLGHRDVSCPNREVGQRDRSLLNPELGNREQK